MPNTFTQLYIHNVIAVDFHQSLIKSEWEEELYKYITGIVQNQGQKMIRINGVEDHLHFLMGFKPTCVISDLLKEVKRCSTDFINDKKLTKQKFKWQEGFGSFTVGHRQLHIVDNYIKIQKEHHQKKNFKEEYLTILKDNDVKYDERYLFLWRP